jgi:hypothetical protein
VFQVLFLNIIIFIVIEIVFDIVIGLGMQYERAALRDNPALW